MPVDDSADDDELRRVVLHCTQQRRRRLHQCFVSLLPLPPPPRPRPLLLAVPLSPRIRAAGYGRRQLLALARPRFLPLPIGRLCIGLLPGWCDGRREGRGWERG